MSYSRVLLMLAVVGPFWLGGLLGCEGEEPIRKYSALKDPPHVHRERLEWTVPGEWIEWPGDEMTYAGFTISESPKIELLITAFDSKLPSAGDVTANVNRWRRQLGVPAASGEEINKDVKILEVDGRAVQVVDLLGPAGNAQQRTLAAMAVDADRVWFFTIKGPADKVGERKKEFEQFVASLKFNSAREPLTWVTPAGWEDGGRRPMRYRTYYAGEASERVDISVTPLEGSFGSLLENINRWRAQVGLEPVAKVEDQPTERLEVGGKPAAFFDMTGPGSPQQPNQRMLLYMVAAGETNVWFVKMIGPAKTVAEQKENFQAFVKSIEFAAAGKR